MHITNIINNNKFTLQLGRFFDDESQWEKVWLIEDGSCAMGRPKNRHRLDPKGICL